MTAVKPLTEGRRRTLLAETLRDIAAALRTVDASMTLIHDSLNGHPQAASYDTPTRSSRTWCWEHERDHQQCEHEALACGGDPIAAIDPTGDAATRLDRAASAARSVDRDIETLATRARGLADLLARWSPASNEMQRPDLGSPTAPDGWCTQCFLATRQHEPVSAHHTGQVCRWCGDFRTAHGCLPPLPVLRWRHDGRNVTQNIIDRHLRTPTRRSA